MKAILITQQSLDPSTAMTLRQCSICKLLKENYCDVEVIYICDSKKTKPSEINGIIYHKLEKYGNKYVDFILRPIYFTRFIVSVLTNQEICPDFVHVTGIPLITFQVIKKISKKYGMQLSLDSVEWYSVDEFIGLYYFYIGAFIEWIRVSIRIRFLIDQSMHIFSISTYLNNYFNLKDIATYRLPIVLDSQNYPIFRPLSDNLLRITYAGSPGRKDYLKEIVMAVEYLTQADRSKIEFVLFGVDYSSLCRMSSISLKQLKQLGCIHPLGRVEKKRVLHRLQETDFTILIRSSTARYAKAGFPTKVVESLMSSTPVICNMTSDLGMYLNDGYDCIEVKDESPEEIAKALRKALALTPEQKDQMKKNARKTAEENFDYRLYVESFGKFIRNEE